MKTDLVYQNCVAKRVFCVKLLTLATPRGIRDTLNPKGGAKNNHTKNIASMN